MLVREYPIVTEVDNSDVIIIDKESGGTKIITFENLVKGIDGGGGSDPDPTPSGDLSLLSVEMRRILYRGKNLGNIVTNAQLAEIKAGTFDDMYIGDYWEIGGVKWLIADFDYWLNCGDQDNGMTDHHVVIVPEKSLYNGQMNTTNVTTGGYNGSAMRGSGLNNAKTMINTAFGSAVKTHREYITNAVTNGVPSGGLWVDSVVDLMNEVMLYGCYTFAPTSNGSVGLYGRISVSNSQLALFMLNPKMIKIRENYWLRDVVSAALFALVGPGGYADHYVASASAGVRPVFAIG